MRIAVQGCSHGSLTAIYDTVAQYTARTSDPVDLLLLCGDFQALRSSHDFASLAVPPKYHALGTFHQYYSGERKAPILTIVIGGNHEASNYMWELYHGGWLAENIYYLGAAGSVYVDGLRIVGASGIYKDHDYHKGHFEKVPYNNSTLRSVYHIRQYDVAKLMQLTPSRHTIFLSHDWPISIAKHGDTGALLRRKPFFRDEVNSNTLGSPPLFNLLNHIQPSYWFAAHLHVKFAAIYDHASGSLDPTASATAHAGFSVNSYPSSSTNRNAQHDGNGNNPDEIAIDDEDDFEGPAGNSTSQVAEGSGSGNPDEIVLDDDEFDEPGAGAGNGVTGPVDSGNPEEITISDDDFDDAPLIVQAATVPTQETMSTTEPKHEDGPALDESVDAVEKAREEGGDSEAQDVISAPIEKVQEAVEEAKQDTSVAQGSGGRRTKFLALDKCGPGKEFIQFLEVPTPNPSPSGQPPRLTFDTEWLAISRAIHPYLSTTIHQATLPPPQAISQLIADEKQRIADEGLLVPSAEVEEDGNVQLVWEKGDIDVGRVQRFWPTAPSEGQPGGSASVFYTNPQTEAFCGMLGVPNKVNPAPKS